MAQTLWDIYEAQPHYVKLITLVGVWVFLIIAYRYFSDPLRKVPGPIWTRFTNLWITKHYLHGNVQEVQMDLHKKYGPVVRLSPNHYSLDDLEAFDAIYAHGTNFPKSDFYDPYGPPAEGYATYFSEKDLKLHGQKRKKVSSLFSLSNLLSYEAFVDNNGEKLFDQLTKMAQEKKVFSVGDWMQYYAFDVIGSLTTGESFNFIEHGGDPNSILNEVHHAQIYGTTLGFYWGSMHSWVWYLSEKLGISLPRFATTRYARKNIAHKRQLIEEGETTAVHTGKQDFLEKLFIMKEKGKVNELDIEMVVLSNIHAGSDTTAIALTAIIYFLIRHPPVLRTLRAEIETARATGQLSTPVAYKEAHELPYLQAVIKESLRLHPSVGIPLPRVVPAGGATLAGHHFPAGTVVSMNSWVLHRNRDAYGADADEFRPERWLDGGKERVSQMDHYSLAFGAGARTCMGKNISMLEINKLIPELVLRYDFELESPEKEWELRNILFVLQKFNCFIRKREYGA